MPLAVARILFALTLWVQVVAPVAAVTIAANPVSHAVTCSPDGDGGTDVVHHLGACCGALSHLCCSGVALLPTVATVAPTSWNAAIDYHEPSDAMAGGRLLVEARQRSPPTSERA